MASALVRPDPGSAFSYAGSPLSVLAGADGSGPYSAAEMVIWAGWCVADGIARHYDEPAEAAPDQPARVLGLWSPALVGPDFMRAIGAALPASGPSDPGIMRELYELHGSRLLP
jgi:hypothetical protein